jgi:epidermal growth factor receptor substrate 15
VAAIVPANLNLTAEEKRVFFQLFQAADTDRLGVVTGEIAVKFFEKTKLPPPTLGEVRGSRSGQFYKDADQAGE